MRQWFFRQRQLKEEMATFGPKAMHLARELFFPDDLRHHKVQRHFDFFNSWSALMSGALPTDKECAAELGALYVYATVHSFRDVGRMEKKDIKCE